MGERRAWGGQEWGWRACKLHLTRAPSSVGQKAWRHSACEAMKGGELTLFTGGAESKQRQNTGDSEASVGGRQCRYSSISVDVPSRGTLYFKLSTCCSMLDVRTPQGL